MAAYLDLFDNANTRVHRAIEDPFEVFPQENLDHALRLRFRFDKEGIEHLTDLIKPNIEQERERGRYVTPQVKVMTALRYLASNSHQLGIADCFKLQQSSISRYVNLCVDEWAKHISKFVYFPTNEAVLRQNQQQFYKLASMPEIIGCIDGTHVSVTVQPTLNNDYVNRKGKTTINVQAVCDPVGRYMNLVAKWPGCTHDSFVLRNSDVWDAFEEKQIPFGKLLGKIFLILTISLHG
jgi:hypothetical protein